MRRSTYLSAISALAAASSAQAFTITPTFPTPSEWTTDQQAIVQQAITDWTSRLAFPGANDQNVNIAFHLINTPSYLGLTIPPAGWSDLPSSPGVQQTIDISSFYPAYDMLTIVRHELGHALGMASGVYGSFGNDKWLSHVTGDVFDPGGLNVPMYTADDVHVAVPGDLMYFELPPGIQRGISAMDVQMLSLAYGYTALPLPEPVSLAVLGLGGTVLLMRRRPAR